MEEPCGRPGYKASSGVAVVLQWSYSGVAVVLEWCCSGVAVVLQWRCSDVAVALQWCCSGIAVALQWRCNGVAVALQKHCRGIADTTCIARRGVWRFFQSLSEKGRGVVSGESGMVGWLERDVRKMWIAPCDGTYH